MVLNHDEPDPFEKHELNDYDFEKNKHKKQKNFNRVNFITLSSLVFTSAWSFTSLFNN